MKSQINILLDKLNMTYNAPIFISFGNREHHFPLTFRFVLGFVCRLQYRLVEVLSKLLSTEALPGAGPAVLTQAIKPVRPLL